MQFYHRGQLYERYKRCWICFLYTNQFSFEIGWFSFFFVSILLFSNCLRNFLNLSFCFRKIWQFCMWNRFLSAQLKKKKKKMVENFLSVIFDQYGCLKQPHNLCFYPVSPFRSFFVHRLSIHHPTPPPPLNRMSPLQLFRFNFHFVNFCRFCVLLCVAFSKLIQSSIAKSKRIHDWDICISCIYITNPEFNRKTTTTENNNQNQTVTFSSIQHTSRSNPSNQWMHLCWHFLAREKIVRIHRCFWIYRG